jgi:hypothetical protein
LPDTRLEKTGPSVEPQRASIVLHHPKAQTLSSSLAAPPDDRLNQTRPDARRPSFRCDPHAVQLANQRLPVRRESASHSDYTLLGLSDEDALHFTVRGCSGSFVPRVSSSIDLTFMGRFEGLGVDLKGPESDRLQYKVIGGSDSANHRHHWERVLIEGGAEETVTDPVATLTPAGR